MKKMKLFSGLIAGIFLLPGSTMPVSAGYLTGTKSDAATVATTDAKLGDPNGDGAINAVDASKILLMYATTSTGGTITEEERAASDVNKDSRVDAVDASTVLAYYAYTGSGGTNSLEDYLAKPPVTSTTTTNKTTTTTTTTTTSVTSVKPKTKPAHNTSPKTTTTYSYEEPLITEPVTVPPDPVTVPPPMPDWILTW